MKSKMTLVMALGLAIAVGAGAVFAASLTPMGWWKFDEPNGVTANDFSGFGHNGTIYGSAAFVQDADMGNVLQVYGPSGQVAVPHDASFEPETGTISIWVKPVDGQDADLVRKTTDFMVNRQQSDTAYAYGLRIRRSGAVEGIINNDDPTASSWLVIAASKASTVAKGEWNHLAMRWDGTMLAVFVNGKLVAASAYTPIPGSGLSYHGSSDLQIGALWGDFSFNGSLSDLRLFSTPLSEAEINKLYTSKAPSGGKVTKNGKSR